MTKRISIIALIISICAVICGLVFVDVDEMVYEMQNGPMLVTPGFILQVNEAYSIEPDFFKQIKIFPMNMNVIGISHDPINKNSARATYIYDKEFGKHTVSDPKQIQRTGQPIKFIKLSTLQLNKLIDKLKFKDPKNRAQKKREILKKVKQLFVTAKKDSMLSGYKQKQWTKRLPIELK